MKEIRAITAAYQSIDLSRNRAALATVVRVEGSSYRRTGARMLVLDDGTYLGGISGGCLEGDALQRAQRGIALQRPSVITYDTTQEDAHQIGVGLGCQGIIDVLFTPLDSGAENPVALLAGLTETREPVIVLTVTGCAERLTVAGCAEGNTGMEGLALGKTMVVEPDGVLPAAIAGASFAAELSQDIRDCRMRLESRTVICLTEGGPLQFFIEVILPAIHLVIYGGGNDIYPLSRMAAELGWDRTVVMNTLKTDTSRLASGTKLIHNRSGKEPQTDPWTAVMLMSHDLLTDTQNLRTALTGQAAYIGMLGPRKRAEKIFRAISGAEGSSGGEEEKAAEVDWARIYAPAGLDIGAVSPEEIALSVLAEIRAHFAGRGGMSLRLREDPIHTRETSSRDSKG